MPPVYSAVQIEGRRAYQMARRGEAVELAPRDVVIHEATLLEWDGTDPARPVAVVDVECSAGTYIRALARDLGARLESGAYLGALVRTASGSFRLEDAVSFDGLREHAADGPAGIQRVLLPIDAGLEDLPHAVDHAGRDPPAGRGPDHRPQDAARGAGRPAGARRWPGREDRRGLSSRGRGPAPAQGAGRAARRVGTPRPSRDGAATDAPPAVEPA